MKSSDESGNVEMIKELRRSGLITTPGMIALGLGAYATFFAKGKAFHPLLDNRLVAVGLLLFGVASFVWGAVTDHKIRRRYKNSIG